MQRRLAQILSLTCGKSNVMVCFAPGYSSTIVLATGGALRVPAGRLEGSHGRPHRVLAGFVALIGTACDSEPDL